SSWLDAARWRSAAPSKARALPFAELVAEHAGHHRDDEQRRAVDAGAHRRQGGGRAVAGQPPAGSEQERPDQQAAIDRVRQLRESRRQDRRTQAPRRPPGDCEDAHAAGHDERERGVPAAGHVEEAEHLRRIGHSGQRQAEREERAAGEGDQPGQRDVSPGAVSHRTPEMMCRTAKVAIMPVTTNRAVAVIDRRDRRETPQMPWPLVHPLPRRVPNPTRRPAATSSGPEPRAAPYAPGATIAPMRPPPTNPARNMTRQPTSPTRGTSAPPRIPLTPAIRPDRMRRRAAAPPMIAPPRSATR